MYDNPSIYPTLPPRETSEDDRRLMLDPVRGTEWETCWEYVVTHDLSEREGAAFWTAANLMLKSLTGGQGYECSGCGSAELPVCNNCGREK